MNEALKQAIVGEPVTVTLGGKTYPLAFPIQAVILYKRETADLDRQRGFCRSKLDPKEVRELRESRRKLLMEADTLRPKKGTEWDPEKYAQWDALMDDALAIKISIDEDSGAGDSLYDVHNWRKINPIADPERVLLALWVGLHRFVEQERDGRSVTWAYLPSLTRETLGALVDLSNGGDLTDAIGRALTAHLIAPREPEDDGDDPNPQKPGTTAPAEMTLVNSTK